MSYAAPSELIHVATPPQAKKMTCCF